MNTSKIVIFSSALIFLLSCSNNPKKVIDNSTSKILPKGYQCLLAPDGFFTPGYIYEIGKDGVSYSISFSNKELKIYESDAGIPSIVLKNDGASDIGASYAGIGSAKLQYTLSSNTSFHFSDVKHLSTDKYADTVALEFLNSNPELVTPGNQIFIIRDSFLAGHVKYNISKSMVTNLGGEAKFKEDLVSVNGKIYESINNSDYVLEREFNPRVPVCFKAREILYSTGLGGEIQFERTVESKIPKNVKFIKIK